MSAAPHSEDLNQAEEISVVHIELGEIVGKPGQQVTRELQDFEGNPAGQMTIQAEQLRETNEKCGLLCGGVELEDVAGFFSRFRPFFSLLRTMENGTLQRVYTSEPQYGRNPSWDSFDITTQVLCNGDYSRPLFIEVCDHCTTGNHTLVGTGQFSLREINERGLRSIRLINQTKVREKDYRDSGLFIIKQIDIIRETSFLDYIAGGCQINLICAVDFTASNKDPNLPESLHYLDPHGLNQYEAALMAVGEILLNYDSDKLVPMYGFGGNLKGQISHCFHMNFNPGNAEVKEMKGIMNAYRNSLNMVDLSGPTLFSHVLEKVVNIAEETPVTQDSQQYYVLLILTDGEIHDMQETIDLIVRGSHTAMSIIIVGLGDDSFQNMKCLDADDIPLVSSDGTEMERDIVQFVPYRDVDNNPSRLASEVLDELPREIVNYFTSKSIYPNQPFGLQRLGTSQPTRNTTSSVESRSQNAELAELMKHREIVNRDEVSH